MNYFIQTFGCQMNYADSEKINMILIQSGFKRVLDSNEADIIIFNTCSVRKKGEDRVYGLINDIRKKESKTGKKTIIAISGCMVRKTGINQKYYTQERKRIATKNIEFLKNEKEIFNSDDKIFGKTDKLDFIFRIEEVSLITQILSIILDKQIGSDEKYNDYLKVKQFQENPASANVIIQTGCDNFCTYCIVPHTRGREKSRDKDEILAEIREVVAKGTKEIVLLGQNVNSYGKEFKTKLWNEAEMKWANIITSDELLITNSFLSSGAEGVERSGTNEVEGSVKNNKNSSSVILGLDPGIYKNNKNLFENKEDLNNRFRSTAEGQKEQEGQNLKTKDYELKTNFKTPFRELLEEIDKIEGIDRIRFTSSNPHDMTVDILDAHFSLNKTCNYLHFALQSGDDEILKNMNRKHTYRDFKTQVEYLRARDPYFAISTDIIVGFPGETEAQFENTLKAMKELVFDFAYIARYSERSGTTASKLLTDNVSYQEKSRRWHILNNLLKESFNKRANLLVGKIEPVLIYGTNKSGDFFGRTRNFKEIFFPIKQGVKIGDIVNVKINKVNGWKIIGEMI